MTTYSTVIAADLPELTEAALACQTLAGARRLAGWVGSGRNLTARGLLRPAEAVQACRDLDIAFPGPRLRSAQDVMELDMYWQTALGAGLVVIDGRRAAQAERDTLGAWFSAVTTLLELDEGDPCAICLIALHTLQAAEGPLALEDCVAAIDAGINQLDLEGEAGLPCPDCGEVHSLTELGYDDEEDEVGHIVFALSLLSDFDAVKMTDEMAELTLLGRYLAQSVFHQYLAAADADAEAVTAAITAVPPALTDAVAGPWLSARSASDAVRELLAFAESAAGPRRLAGIALARNVGDDAADVWREWAKRPGFGAYARQWLAGHDEPGAEQPADGVWLVVDAICIMADGLSEQLPAPQVHDLIADQFGAVLAEGVDALRASGHPRAEEIATWVTSPDECWQPKPGAPVCQLKVTLRSVHEPSVWRQVLVPAEITLEDLHEVIQSVMGWEDDHLHEFSTGRRQHDPNGLLSDVLTKRSDKLLYTYDFGDGWEHDIALEQKLTAQAGQTYPVCLAGEGACPPEDCGGPYGYENLKGILADPSHDEHFERLEWMGLDDGDDFDATEFSLAEVNDRLSWFANPDIDPAGAWS